MADFEATLMSMRSFEALAAPVEIRFLNTLEPTGQKGTTTHVLAGGMQSPRITGNHCHGFAHPLSATIQEHGVAIANAAHRIPVASKTEHLAEIGGAFRPGLHAAILLHEARWIRRDYLPVPPNLTVRHPPRCSRDLNAINGTMFFLKSNRFANRVSRALAALKNGRWTGWQRLTTTPHSSRHDPEQLNRRARVKAPVLHSIDPFCWRAV